MFLPHKIDGSNLSMSPEYLPCGAMDVKVGQAMVQSGGNLAICSGTIKPTYISLCEKTCKAGDIIPVLRVRPDTVFQTEWSASASSIKLGNKVTIESTGLKVTATTTEGVAEVVAIEGTAAGDKCYVRFP